MLVHERMKEHGGWLCRLCLPLVGTVEAGLKCTSLCSFKPLQILCFKLKVADPLIMIIVLFLSLLQKKKKICVKVFRKAHQLANLTLDLKMKQKYSTPPSCTFFSVWWESGRSECLPSSTIVLLCLSLSNILKTFNDTPDHLAHA